MVFDKYVMFIVVGRLFDEEVGVSNFMADVFLEIFVIRISYTIVLRFSFFTVKVDNG